MKYGHFKDCMGCTDRFVGCSITCEKYKAAKEAYNRERDAARAGHDAELLARDFALKAAAKTIKRQRRRRK